MKSTKKVFSVEYYLPDDEENRKYAYVIAEDALEAAVITSTHGTVKRVAEEGDVLEPKL